MYVMFCKNCGNEIKDGMKFCGKCGTLQNESSGNLTSSPSIQAAVLPMLKNNKKLLFIFIAVVVLIIIGIVWAVAGNSSNESSMRNANEESEIVTELSKYQKTNSYGISCDGNNDLAIEAANVFADKYGGSGHDWTLTKVDASVSGMSGTYRYSYNWAGSSYTATTYFEIKDYGSYRNYSWDGDFVDLFYGN